MATVFHKVTTLMSTLQLNSIFKFCQKCQTETERNARGGCKLCAKAYNESWRAANPEYAKSYNAAWAAANPERKQANDAAWRAANPERAKASDAAWRAANPERNKANKEAWAKANPEATRLHNQNRRAKARINGGVLSKGLSSKLFKLQRGKCACCSLSLGDDYHLDHVLPIALGGPNVDDNMQLLRKKCNQQKNAKHPVDFMQSRGFLL